MNRLRRALALVTIAALAVSAQAEQAPTNAPLRLAVDLVDGSRVIGIPALTAFPVQTAYAKMDIPVRQVRGVTLADDHETAAFDLANGDKLTGVLTLEPIALTTLFGRVSIGIALIKRLDVIRGDGPSRQGLVLHFDFNGDDRDRVPDASKKGNDGQPVGAAWGRDERRGGYLQFDGKQTLVNAGHGPELSITRDLSISAWLRKSPKTFGDQLQPILGKDDGPDWPGRSYMLYLCDNADNNFVAFNYGVAAGGTGGGHDLRAYDPRISDDQWHHVAVVHETGAGNRLYVDGKCVAEDREGSPLPSNPQTRTMVGKTQAWEPWFFFGAMDDVMIYNRPLSSAEVKALYEAQK